MNILTKNKGINMEIKENRGDKMGKNRKKRKLKARGGYALAMVLVVMVILSMVALSILALSRNNIQQASAQEENMRAHYLARSGIDITYEALMTNNEEKIEVFIADTTTILPLKDKMVFEDIGEVDIELNKDAEWVHIKAIGKTTGKTYNNQATITMSIKKDNTKITKWTNN